MGQTNRPFIPQTPKHDERRMGMDCMGFLVHKVYKGEAGRDICYDIMRDSL